MEFLNSQEKAQLQKILTHRTLLKTADAELRSAVLSNCGLGEYSALLPLEATTFQFVFSLCAKLSKVYITVEHSQRLGLIVFLEYLSQTDLNLAAADREIIEHVIGKWNLAQKNSAGNVLLLEQTNLPVRYLESLCTTYAQWRKVYTITDVVGQKQAEAEQSPLLFDFDLMVQTVEREREERGKGEEKVERLMVLEGLRKYASQHVLLVGRPGSGKSTALARLLLEEAQKSKEAGGTGGVKIPVLVELRYYRTSILDLIQDFLQRHDPNLTVDAETLKTWLRQGQLLLLVDGLNELPNDEARRDLQKFRQDYQKTTPMIFTTRDLGVGGDLDIVNKLEMQPLSEAQMQQFVQAYLPQQGEEMLRQLGSRLREFGQTPLLLWMLCSLFSSKMGKVPSNLGKVFRQFSQSYYGKLKQDVPVTEESRDWCQLLLEQLAFTMTQGKNRTDLQVAIPKQEAEEMLTAFLRDEGLEQPRSCACKWLKDLLKHHLIQMRAGDQIEFRHQLIQEYYTAEYLLKVLQSRAAPLTPQSWGEQDKTSAVFPPKVGGVRGGNSLNPGGISDEKLKREYLNYLKWTEPLALMLELVEDEAQVVRVVKLALEVDLRLGARLAGEVKLKHQAQTVGLLAGLEVPQLLQIQLLNLTKSEKAIPGLIKALEDDDYYVRSSAVEALGKIGSEVAIPDLIKALEDDDYDVRSSAADALGKIGSEVAIPGLIKDLENDDYNVRSNAVDALGKISSEVAIPDLIKALEDDSYYVRGSAVKALGQIGSEVATPGLIKALEDDSYYVRSNAVEALDKIGSESAIPGLIKALEDDDYYVRSSAVDALGKIGSEVAIPDLIKALEDDDYYVRSSAVDALGKIGSEAAIHGLIRALADENYNVCNSAAKALSNICLDTIEPDSGITLQNKDLEISKPEAHINLAKFLNEVGPDPTIINLAKAIKNEDSDVRWLAADALGRIGTESVICPLVKALEDPDSGVRYIAAYGLGNIGSDAVIAPLVKALEDEDYFVRQMAVHALGKNGSDAAIFQLAKFMANDNFFMFIVVAYLLEEISSNTAFIHLNKALKNPDNSVRLRAVEALGKIGTEKAIPSLVKCLEDKDYAVRWMAVCGLKNIDSYTVIFLLVKALEDDDYVVRWIAADALGKIGTEAAIFPLVKALEDEDYFMRSIAVGVLGKTGADVAIPQLVKALEDSFVFSMAADALGEIGSEAAIPQLDEALKNEDFVAANQGRTLDEATKALQTIQERCQFYNPTLTQPIPTALPSLS